MNIDAYKAIGVLDSGVGGLTVVKEIHRFLPHESLVYFGDTQRMPYGSRPHSEVRQFTLEIMEFLQTQEVKMMVVACNSATAAGLHHYTEQVDVPVIGVVTPGVRAALRATRNGCIGVIGTSGTIASGAYEEAIKEEAGKRDNLSVKIFSKACPLLVLLVENELVNTSEARRVTEEYLTPLKEEGVDTLIMGCTHYPLMEGLIKEVMGDEVELISSAQETALEVRQVLSSNNLLNPLNSSEVRHRFFVSGAPFVFQEIGKKLLKEDVKAFQVVFS